MKDVDDILKFAFGITVCTCLLIYFSGMFILKQPTNDANKDLRMRLVDLLIYISSQVLGKILYNKKDKL